jgi:hypothetical protein
MKLLTKKREKSLLFSMRAEDSNSNSSHLLKLKNICDPFISIGKEANEEYLVLITLNNLSPLGNFIETLNVISDSIKIKFEKLCNQLSQKDGQKKHFKRNIETSKSPSTTKIK